MPLSKEYGAEPIPGYRLLERLGRGGCGEVWKCEAPGGLLKAIKFVPGYSLSQDTSASLADEELQALNYIKDIRHPFLLSLDRVEVVAGELVLVTELAEGSLFELAQRYRQSGLLGIPRAELVHYLSEAAEVLDLLMAQHNLQHLDVKPHNIFLVGGHVKVGDFGLVRRLTTGDRPQVGAVSPLYAAPEVFLGRPSPQSDQYSLAIVYQELLTGRLPFSGANVRQLLLAHTQEEPDLSPLPETDRPIVARALAKEPAARYPTCQAFVQALQGCHLPGPWPGETSVRNDRCSATTPLRDGAEGMSTTPLPDLQRATIEAVPSPHGTLAQSLTPSRPDACSQRLLAGYRLDEHLYSTPLLECWRATAPNGQACLLKVLYGIVPDSQQRDEAVLRFQLLQHPTLLPAEIVLCEPGRLVIATDWVSEGLPQRWRAYQAQGLPGIPAEELWDYLWTAAEVLDYIYQQHSIQHGLLQPQVFCFAQGRLVLADLGLAQLFWLPAQQPLAQYHPRYSAPELFAGRLSASADQFSLAVLYCELLTGQHPFRGQVANRGQPALEGVPSEEHPALVRALHPDPEQRWPSCQAFVQALTRESPPSKDRFHLRLQEQQAQQNRSAQLGNPSPPQTPLAEMLQQLVEQAKDPAVPRLTTSPHFIWGEGYLQSQFLVSLPLGAVRRRLETFRQECHGQLIHESDGTYTFHILLPVHLWQKWLGQQPGLEIQVYLRREHPLAVTSTQVWAILRPLRCSHRRGEHLLRNLGLSLLDRLQRILAHTGERRFQDRLLWPWTVAVRPVCADGTFGKAILCRGKDISASGIGFYLPHELPVAEVLVELPPTPYTPALTLPAVLVRAQRCGDGWYEVGALFSPRGEHE